MVDDDDAVLGTLVNAGEDRPIPPRTIHQRIRLAIYWAMQGTVTKDQVAALDDLPQRFIRELNHVGFKLVWDADGGEISKAAWEDSNRRDSEITGWPGRMPHN